MRHEPSERIVSRKLAARGRHTVLPCSGDRIVEINLGINRLTVLIVEASDGSQCQFEFEDQILLVRGADEIPLEGSKPGVTFDPRLLGPLLKLLGTTVTDAIAEQDGKLHLWMSDGWELIVTPTTAYEAWHFNYPRPGRPVAGDLANSISVTGCPGHLIEGRCKVNHAHLVATVIR